MIGHARAFLVAGLALALALHGAAQGLPRPWRRLPPAAFVVIVFPPFDFGHPRWPALALGVAAVIALVRHLCGRTNWVKTAHVGAHLGQTAHPQQVLRR